MTSSSCGQPLRLHTSDEHVDSRDAKQSSGPETTESLASGRHSTTSGSSSGATTPASESHAPSERRSFPLTSSSSPGGASTETPKSVAVKKGGAPVSNGPPASGKNSPAIRSTSVGTAEPEMWTGDQVQSRKTETTKHRRLIGVIGTSSKLSQSPTGREVSEEQQSSSTHDVMSGGLSARRKPEVLKNSSDREDRSNANRGSDVTKASEMALTPTVNHRVQAERSVKTPKVTTARTERFKAQKKDAIHSDDFEELRTPRGARPSIPTAGGGAQDSDAGFRLRLGLQYQDMLLQNGGQCRLNEAAALYLRTFGRQMSLRGDKLRALLSQDGGVPGITLDGDIMRVSRLPLQGKKDGVATSGKDQAAVPRKHFTKTFVNQDALSEETSQSSGRRPHDYTARGHDRTGHGLQPRATTSGYAREPSARSGPRPPLVQEHLETESNGGAALLADSNDTDHTLHSAGRSRRTIENTPGVQAIRESYGDKTSPQSSIQATILSGYPNYGEEAARNSFSRSGSRNGGYADVSFHGRVGDPGPELDGDTRPVPHHAVNDSQIRTGIYGAPSRSLSLEREHVRNYGGNPRAPVSPLRNYEGQVPQSRGPDDAYASQARRGMLSAEYPSSRDWHGVPSPQEKLLQVAYGAILCPRRSGGPSSGIAAANDSAVAMRSGRAFVDGVPLGANARDHPADDRRTYANVSPDSVSIRVSHKTRLLDDGRELTREFTGAGRPAGVDGYAYQDQGAAAGNESDTLSLGGPPRATAMEAAQRRLIGADTNSTFAQPRGAGGFASRPESFGAVRDHDNFPNNRFEDRHAPTAPSGEVSGYKAEEEPVMGDGWGRRDVGKVDYNEPGSNIDVPAPALMPLERVEPSARPPIGHLQGARLVIKGTHPAVPERRIHVLASEFGTVGKIEVLEGFVCVHMKHLQEADLAAERLNGIRVPHVSGSQKPLAASVWSEEAYQALMAKENMRKYADSMRKASTWYERHKNIDSRAVTGERLPCRFFALGRGCIFGRDCVFSHDLGNPDGGLAAQGAREFTAADSSSTFTPKVKLETRAIPLPSRPPSSGAARQGTAGIMPPVHPVGHGEKAVQGSVRSETGFHHVHSGASVSQQVDDHVRSPGVLSGASHGRPGVGARSALSAGQGGAATFASETTFSHDRSGDMIAHRSEPNGARDGYGARRTAGGAEDAREKRIPQSARDEYWDTRDGIRIRDGYDGGRLDRRASHAIDGRLHGVKQEVRVSVDRAHRQTLDFRPVRDSDRTIESQFAGEPAREPAQRLPRPEDDRIAHGAYKPLLNEGSLSRRGSGYGGTDVKASMNGDHRRHESRDRIFARGQDPSPPRSSKRGPTSERGSGHIHRSERSDSRARVSHPDFNYKRSRSRNRASSPRRVGGRRSLSRDRRPRDHGDRRRSRSRYDWSHPEPDRSLGTRDSIPPRHLSGGPRVLRESQHVYEHGRLAVRGADRDRSRDRNQGTDLVRSRSRAGLDTNGGTSRQRRDDGYRRSNSRDAKRARHASEEGRDHDHRALTVKHEHYREWHNDDQDVDPVLTGCARRLRADGIGAGNGSSVGTRNGTRRVEDFRDRGTARLDDFNVRPRAGRGGRGQHHDHDHNRGAARVDPLHHHGGDVAREHSDARESTPRDNSQHKRRPDSPFSERDFVIDDGTQERRDQPVRFTVTARLGAQPPPRVNAAASAATTFSVTMPNKLNQALQDQPPPQTEPRVSRRGGRGRGGFVAHRGRGRGGRSVRRVDRRTEKRAHNPNWSANDD